jgi:hypothetical protein
MSRQSFSKSPATRSTREDGASASTAVRNSSIPKAAATQTMSSRPITHDQIAKRAYEISQSQQRGSEFENWIRAERELKTR